MKAYTDIEQSKKLAEILPIESADMRYAPFGDTHPWFWDNNLLEKEAIPCWSLAALFEVLNMPALTQNNDDGWDVAINDPKYPDEFIEIHAQNLVDACYEMILKLHEQKLI